MSLRARQYSSLTGSRVFQRYAANSKVLTVPNTLAVSLSLVKEVLHKYDTADDAHITLLIKAVTSQIERYCGYDFRPKTRRSYWLYPKPVIELPNGPHSNVSNVKAIDEQGNEQALTQDDDYYIDGQELYKLRFNQYYHALEVEHDSGYAQVPDAVQGAIVQEVSFQYKNRNDPNMGRVTSVNGLTLEARHLLLSGGLYKYA